jgi:hypothetical protein
LVSSQETNIKLAIKASERNLITFIKMEFILQN